MNHKQYNVLIVIENHISGMLTKLKSKIMAIADSINKTPCLAYVTSFSSIVKMRLFLRIGVVLKKIGITKKAANNKTHKNMVKIKESNWINLQLSSAVNEEMMLKAQQINNRCRFFVKNLSLVCLSIFLCSKNKFLQVIIPCFLLFCLVFVPFWNNNNAFSFEKSSICTTEIEKYEIELKIPRGLLGAISKVESSYNPIAINHNGTTIFKNTRNEALGEIKGLVGKGERNIDIGCMQLNIRWHGKYFQSLDEMLDSRNNVKHAALFLKGLFHRHGSWYEAVRYYHSSNIEAQNKYSARIIEAWANQGKNKS